MLQLVFIAVTIIYLVMACCLFTQWFDLIQQSGCMTLEQRLLSRVFLILVTIFWPLVVPFAYLELLLKTKKNREIIGIVLDQPVRNYRK